MYQNVRWRHTVVKFFVCHTICVWLYGWCMFVTWLYTWRKSFMKLNNWDNTVIFWQFWKNWCESIMSLIFIVIDNGYNLCGLVSKNICNTRAIFSCRESENPTLKKKLIIASWRNNSEYTIYHQSYTYNNSGYMKYSCYNRLLQQKLFMTLRVKFQ